MVSKLKIRDKIGISTTNNGTTEPIEDHPETSEPIEPTNGGGDDNPNNRGVETTTFEPVTIPDGQPTLKIKAKRGRPPGARNRPKDAQAGVYQEPVIQAKKETVKPSKSKKKVMNEDEAVQVTQTLLTMLEGVSVSMLGEDARINDTEKMLMYASIPKMLSSVSESAVESVSKVLYPVTALVAIGAYSLRLAHIYSEKTKTEETDQFTSSQIVNNNPVHMNGQTPATEAPFSTNGEDKTIWTKPDLRSQQRGF